MADTKLSALTAGSAISAGDLFYTSQSAASRSVTGTQLKTFTSASPVLVTPTLGVGTATSLAIGGGTIGTDALEVTGTSTFNGATIVAGGSFGLSGNISAAAWTTNGVRYKNVAATLTDTSSSGTVAAAYTDKFGGNTIAASSATTFTNYFTGYWTDPTAGANVTLSNKWAIGADSLKIGTSNQLLVSNAGALTVAGTLTYGGVTLSNAVTGTGNMVLSAAPTLTGTLNSADQVITSASAIALAVGRLGSTTPALQIDASTATSITGIKIKSAATTGGVAVSAIGEAANGNLTIDAQGTGTLTLQGTATGAITLTRATTLSAALTYGGVALSNAVTGTGNMVLSASPTITGTLATAAITATSASATSLAVGRQGTTTPAFAVDSSTASQTAGLKVTGAALNGTVAVVVTDTSGNTNLTINALGTGTIGIGSVSTGAVTITPATTLSGALTYGGVTLSNAVTGTGNMVLSASPTFTGTAVLGSPSATQITFPAFGSNSGSATSEVLAGYEQGTWTATLNSWTNVGSPTVTATYTRIGRLVFVNCNVVPGTTVSTTGGTSTITGLPFTPAVATGISIGNNTVGGSPGGATLRTDGIYPPTISATGNTIMFSGCYYV
ncbi:MAG: hypothetical protein EPO02_13785 [Nitrospirae bacterium]|nr:MAG: hypothetical protein EPO02_13785 [Nitrospirota bacterium]